MDCSCSLLRRGWGEDCDGEKIGGQDSTLVPGGIAVEEVGLNSFALDST